MSYTLCLSAVAVSTASDFESSSSKTSEPVPRPETTFHQVTQYTLNEYKNGSSLTPFGVVDIKVGVVLLRVGRHTHHLRIWKICQLLKSKIKIVVPKRLPPHLMLIPHPSSRLYLTGPSSSVTTSRSWQDCCHQVVRQEASVTGYINKNILSRVFFFFFWGGGGE